MNANEMKNIARTNTVNELTEVLEKNAAVQFADASWAILQTVDGQEIWTEITVKTKAYKATKISPAFDPFVAAQEWKEEQAARENRKADKEREKALKVKAGKKEEA